MGFLTKETLCWQCKRPGTNTCPWDASHGNIPVESWTAEKVPFRGQNGECDSTYHVVDCPLFALDEYYKERTKRYREEECKKRGRKPIVDVERIEYFLRYGWTNKAIALELGLSPNTVARYRSRWYKKQKVRNNHGQQDL